MKKRLMLALMLLTLSSFATLAQTAVVGSAWQEAIRRGNERYSRGEYEAAIREYRQVGQGEAEGFARALYNIGVCYFELGQTEDAILMYRRAASARGGRYPKALYALGVALEIKGRLEEAKDAYEQAVAMSGGKYTEEGLAVAHYRLGTLLGRKGDYTGAAKLFKEAIARSKESFPAAHNNLGVMLALLGHIREAEAEFAAALQESGAGFQEAAYNLRLCRTRSRQETQSAFASLKVSDSAFVLGL